MALHLGQKITEQVLGPGTIIAKGSGRFIVTFDAVPNNLYETDYAGQLIKYPGRNIEPMVSDDPTDISGPRWANVYKRRGNATLEITVHETPGAALKERYPGARIGEAILIKV